MRTTFLQAVKELALGSEDKAWEIAKQDDGLQSHVTKEQWIKFTKKSELFKDFNIHFNEVFN